MKIPTVYVEKTLLGLPRTQAVLQRCSAKHVIEINHYGEIFNRNRQNFRIQKQQPALILAHKTGRKLLPVPGTHGLGEGAGFYFSHMLNCLYDCRYCFLQGMFRSAHYVLFINYEDFIDEIVGLARGGGENAWIFSGYDCDSLALEPVTRFAETFMPTFEACAGLNFEFRTKSTQVRQLLDLNPLPNVVIAASLNPDVVCRQLEHRAPPVANRLNALSRLQQAGWQIGLRFDPLILVDDFRTVYLQFLQQLQHHLDLDAVHSITVGTFRLPATHFRRIQQIHPDEPLFARAMVEQDRLITYPADDAESMTCWFIEELQRYFDDDIIHRQ